MKEKREVLSHTQAVIMFMIMTIALHILCLKIAGIIKGSDDISYYINYGSKILGVILIAGIILFASFTPMRCNWSSLRASGKKLISNLLVSAVISIVVIAILLGFRLYLNTKSPDNREVPWFGLYLNIHMRWFYPLNVVFQEFFIKAFVQENIGMMVHGFDRHPVANSTELCRKRSGKEVAIISCITALFFFILHVQYALYYMTGALLLCLITGLLYERNRNIWGSVIIHFVLGFLPRCLGILQILER